ncbi:putative protein phosphatase 2C-like protein 45 [Cardamine amara subsp. amara]|uniref:RNase H type-1 domain-containing protein n=1 Tax=Cardamine amara subsp. amara TaxID=228776 RepID=A0ABD0ZSN8_CARAN
MWIYGQCGAAVEALNHPRDWPKYRSLLDRFHRILQRFNSCFIRHSSSKANLAARRIAKSVTRDGRVHSYLAVGGPVWLHATLEADRQ